MLHQVEFLIEGDLFHPPIDRLQVSERLIIESAWSDQQSTPTRQSKLYAFAYVGWKDEPNFFREAIAYIDFFCIICALTTSMPVNRWMGAAIPISKFDELGKNKVSFPDYAKPKALTEYMQSEFSKPILLVKERFLLLEKDRQRIMGDYLGLALSYYYYAVQAYSESRFEEMVIDLAIAAEALFSTGKHYKSILKRRLSSFITDDDSKRDEIAKRIGDFYDLRCAIIHGGKKKIPLSDVQIVSAYIQKAIDKALLLKLYTKEEMLSSLRTCLKEEENKSSMVIFL